MMVLGGEAVSYERGTPVQGDTVGSSGVAVSYERGTPVPRPEAKGAEVLHVRAPTTTVRCL